MLYLKRHKTYSYCRSDPAPHRNTVTSKSNCGNKSYDVDRFLVRYSKSSSRKWHMIPDSTSGYHASYSQI